MGMLTASAHLRACGRYDAAPANELMEFGKDRSWHPKLIQISKGQVKFYKELYNCFSAKFTGKGRLVKV
jgi:hypothetical protein